MNTPLLQLWTPENMCARTYTTINAALTGIEASPEGWALEEFDSNLVSRGIIKKTDPKAMARLRLMAAGGAA